MIIFYFKSVLSMQKFIGFDVRHRKCREKCRLRAVQEILQGFPGVHQEVQVILEGVLRIIKGSWCRF